ncbi:MAG: hypothetical protein C4523_12715 [Myxococcales bacterium]|nr:MAG: hypothetical protein C4523_12715 [Myxococcales bacterium]
MGAIECKNASALACDVAPKDSHWAGTYVTLRPQYVFDVKGSYAYIGTNYGVDVVYVGIDYLPIRFGWWPTNGRVLDLTIQEGNLLYLVDGDGLKLLDVGLSILPISKGQVDLASPGLALAVKDRYAYVISGTKLEVVERVNDWALSSVASLELGDSCTDIAIKGSTAYLACWQGIKEVSIHSPSSPQIVGTEQTTKPVVKLRRDERFLYSIQADDSTVGYLFDTNSELLAAGKHNVDHWVRGVSYEGDKVYWINWVWLNARKYD